MEIDEVRFDQAYEIRKKPVTVAPKTPNEPQGRDTFQTPNYAIDLLIPYIPKNIHYIWECAAGEGRIGKRLLDAGYGVCFTDIRAELAGEFNFITQKQPDAYVEKMKAVGWAIITNPPFSIKEEFIERAFEYGVPFAFLINADYSGKHIDWIQRGCEKIIPNRRIDYITPTGRNGKTSSSQFHSMWLTWGFELGRTETFVELSLKEKKENI